MHVSVAEAAMARVKLQGCKAIDRQSAAAGREMLAVGREVIAAFGGVRQLSPQPHRLVEDPGRHRPAPLRVE